VHSANRPELRKDRHPSQDPRNGRTGLDCGNPDKQNVDCIRDGTASQDNRQPDPHPTVDLMGPSLKGSTYGDCSGVAPNPRAPPFERRTVEGDPLENLKICVVSLAFYEDVGMGERARPAHLDRDAANRSTPARAPPAAETSKRIVRLVPTYPHIFARPNTDVSARRGSALT
jgi:hypothetical protein